MDRFSITTFGVARFFMAICVFFCHVFEAFNHWGFLFVSVFFFMSGYGMEKSGKRKLALVRLVPYISFFAWYSAIYFFFFRVWIYPSSWFLVVYFVIMLLYRLIPNVYGLLAAFLALSVFLHGLGFEFGWCASYGAFFFGLLVARHCCLFTLRNCLFFAAGFFLIVFRFEVACWFLLPLFSCVVLSICSWNGFRCLALFGRYSFHFYCVHCLVLGLLGVTWTLGGSYEFWGVLLALLFSVFFSMFFKDYLFKYPVIK